MEEKKKSRKEEREERLEHKKESKKRQERVLSSLVALMEDVGKTFAVEEEKTEEIEKFAGFVQEESSVAGRMLADFIYGFTNAVNLTDGLDGLASSVTLVVACAMMLAVVPFTARAAEAPEILSSQTAKRLLPFLTR